MLIFSKVSKYTKAGILLLLSGLLILGAENIFLDKNPLLTTLYLLPIGCFFSSFICFLISATRKQTMNHPMINSHFLCINFSYLGLVNMKSVGYLVDQVAYG